MLSLVYAECSKYALYVKCPYPECRYDKCHYIEHHGVLAMSLSLFIVLKVRILQFLRLLNNKITKSRLKFSKNGRISVSQQKIRKTIEKTVNLPIFNDFFTNFWLILTNFTAVNCKNHLPVTIFTSFSKNHKTLNVNFLYWANLGANKKIYSETNIWLLLGTAL